MANEWLDTNYKVPESGGNWMKLNQGDNRFRVLGKPVIGYEYWVSVTDEQGKSVRKPKRVDMTTDIQIGDIEEGQSIKHFWAMPVYNFDLKKIQILVLTQKSLQKTITALVKNKKWGSPEGYNLVINRIGEGLDTEYNVTPEPTDKEEEELIAGVRKQYESMNVDMNQMYVSKAHPYGGEPFQKSTEVNLSAEETERVLNS